MIANILIATSFFMLGVIVGGVFAVRSCWDELQKKSKELREAQSDCIILRVYGAED